MRCIIVENVHEFIIPGFYDISCILQVRQMVLRKILQLYNAARINVKEIRATKEKGVEVYFEKENIWTLDAKGEIHRNTLTIVNELMR